METIQENVDLSTSCDESSCQEKNCENNALQNNDSAQHEEASFATLLALVPLLVFTFFGQAGLF